MTAVLIDDIHLPPSPVRAIGAGADDDVALRDSIAAIGQLTPILVREEGNGYVLIAGARRLAAMRALGRPAIEAHVVPIGAAHADAAGAAENMVRAPLHPLDQWRVIGSLRAQGYTLAHAAACLGLTERAARRLDRLSQLSPALLALVECDGMPSASELRVVASAPREEQDRALRKAGPGAGFAEVADELSGLDIDPRHALFDIAAHPGLVEEDLFAQPDADNGPTSTVVDRPRFLALQRQALAEKVAGLGAPHRVVACDGEDPAFPAGYRRTYGNPDKPRKGEIVCHWVRVHFNPGSLDAATLAPAKASAEESEGVPAAKSAPAAKGGAPKTAPHADAPSSDARAIVATAKNTALAARLHALAAEGGCADLLLLACVLAFGARNVAATLPGGRPLLNLRRHAAALIAPEGAASWRREALLPTAAALLAEVLAVARAGDADPVPEWIGHAIGADALLPRFDTPEYLRTLGNVELRRLAIEAGRKPARSHDGLITQLAGKLQDWRPVQFGAPGPEGAA